jgi:hypothetical protein
LMKEIFDVLTRMADSAAPAQAGPASTARKQLPLH